MLPVLVWQAPAQCPDQASVEARLLEALRRVPERASAVEVHGRVSAGGASGWQLELELLEAGAQPRRRQLSAPSCDELSDAAAVAIALALGDSERPPAQTSAAPEPAAAPPRSGSGDASSVSEPTRFLDSEQPTLQRSHRSSLAFGAAALADSGMLPELGWGARLDLHARYDGWSAGLHAVWLAEQERALGGGQGVRFGLLGAGLRACFRPLEGQLALDGCLGLELESLSASPRGLELARDQRKEFLAPFVGAALTWRAAERWALVARLDGLLPARQRYVVNLNQNIHETPSFALRLSIGVEAALAGQ
jgi:hypothetical protein